MESFFWFVVLNIFIYFSRLEKNKFYLALREVFSLYRGTNKRLVLFWGFWIWNGVIWWGDNSGPIFSPPSFMKVSQSYKSSKDKLLLSTLSLIVYLICHWFAGSVRQIDMFEAVAMHNLWHISLGFRCKMLLSDRYTVPNFAPCLNKGNFNLSVKKNRENFCM